VLPFPFHFLDNNHAMNVAPLNYSWTEFYDRVIDLTAYAFPGAPFLVDSRQEPRPCHGG
jgi:hypothetical protein